MGEGRFHLVLQDVVSGRCLSIMSGFVGISSHLIIFEVGAVLPDSVTQAPAYCFNQDTFGEASPPEIVADR